MRESLLEILVSPATKERLELKDARLEEGEIISGRLCSPSGEEFPVTQGVPRFVKDEHYVSSFGLQWNTFRRTQLDSANGTTQSRDTFVEKTGWSLDELEGCCVLEAGCGMGRFLEIASEKARSVVGVDLSLAVEAARENLRARANVHLVQADIFSLPFRDCSFERIFSIGVLHHTPDTRRAFLAILPYLAGGGEISLWVYSSRIRNPVALFFSDFYRHMGRSMRPDALLRLSRCAIPLGRIYQRLPIFGSLLNSLIPISPHPDPDWRWLDTFDWYSPRYQFRHTFDEVRSWFKEGGLEDIKALPVPVSMRGRKKSGNADSRD